MELTSERLEGLREMRAHLERELSFVIDAVLAVTEPGKPGVHRAVVALAQAEGLIETRRRALELAAEAFAWGLMLPEEDDRPGWRQG